MSPGLKSITPQMSRHDWGLLLILSVLWGGTFFFSKIALEALPPLTLVMARVWIGALGLWAYLCIAGVPLPGSAKAWLAFFGMGLLNNVLPFGLIFWGQSNLPQDVAASLAAILNAATPIFGVLVAHVLTRDEKLTPSKIIGVILGVCGVAIMVLPRLRGALPIVTNDHSLAGMAACLLAALVYGFAGIFGRRFKEMGILPVQTAFGQLAASSVVMLPIGLIADHPWGLPLPGLKPVLAILALALVSTSLAFVLYFRILSTAGATNLLLVTFLIPVSAILLGVAVLGERLQLVHAVGMLLIGAGLAAVDGRLWPYLTNRLRLP